MTVQCLFFILNVLFRMRLTFSIALCSHCIIYYNSALLSAFLQIQERNGRQDVVDVISRLSPVAWQHINLNGEYAFNKDRKEIDLAGLLSDVESIS